MADSASISRIVLVGLMGAGKSRFGRHLARALGAPFRDLDRWIEAEAGRAVGRIFAGEGEEGFRVREREALVAALGEPGPLVLATGGGVVLAAENRRLLADRAWVVWLRVEAAEAARRVGDSTHRPLLAGRDAAATLAGLLAEREPLYREVADVVLDTDAASTPAGLLLALARKAPRGSGLIDRLKRD